MFQNPKNNSFFFTSKFANPFVFRGNGGLPSRVFLRGMKAFFCIFLFVGLVSTQQVIIYGGHSTNSDQTNAAPSQNATFVCDLLLDISCVSWNFVGAMNVPRQGFGSATLEQYAY